MDDDRCITCNREGEDGGHLFLKCKSVRALWRSAGMEALQLELTNCSNAKKVVEKLLATDDEQQLWAVLLLNNWWHEPQSSQRRRTATFT